MRKLFDCHISVVNFSLSWTFGLLQQVDRQVSGNFVASFNFFILLSDFIYAVFAFHIFRKILADDVNTSTLGIANHAFSQSHVTLKQKASLKMKYIMRC